MSVMPLANSLMLDFRCLILPRFVYATGDDFEGPKESESLVGPVLDRVEQLAGEVRRVAGALRGSDAGVGV